MSPSIGDTFAAEVRKAAATAASGAFETFGTAAVRALGEMMLPASVGGHASASGDALAQSMVAALQADLRGRIVTDVDAQGLVVGDARVATHLAEFASGAAVSPIDDVAVEHAFEITLGALEGSATIRLKAVCAFDAKSGSPKTSTAARIALAVEWSSEGAAVEPAP